MDDIIEKLSLLDYENQFCKGWKHKKISRIYFAHPPDEEEEVGRLHMLYDMVYWLISLNKEQVSISIWQNKVLIGVGVEQETRCVH